MLTSRHPFVALLFAAAAIPVHSQFVELAQSPGVVHQINSLAYGTKLIDWWGSSQTTSGSRTVYNPDLSVYRVLSFPAPPAGMRWSTIGYITETLFDIDETNIEFCLTASGIDFSGQAVYIFREDGEQLFVQNPGSMFAIMGMGFSGAPIFTSDNQTYMVVHGTDGNGPTRVYSLPGTLPCMDCYGSPSNFPMGGTADAGVRSGVAVYPNPASQFVTVALGWAQADAIDLHDAAGRLIRTERTSGNPRIQISTAGLANGRYTLAVKRAGNVIEALPLVIEQ